jgi:hypothetical protein
MVRMNYGETYTQKVLTFNMDQERTTSEIEHMIRKPAIEEISLV